MFSKLGKEVLYEFIGLKVRVIKSNCPERLGIEGVVIDETKNMLIVRTRKGIKKLPKRECVFEFELEGGKRIKIPGHLIMFRPEERVKKLWKKVLR